MNLGAGAYKVGVARITLAQEKELSIANLRGAPARHHHIELSSITYSYNVLVNTLSSPEIKRGEGWKKQSMKRQASNKAIEETLCKETASRQLCIQVMRSPC